MRVLKAGKGFVVVDFVCLLFKYTLIKVLVGTSNETETKSLCDVHDESQTCCQKNICLQKLWPSCLSHSLPGVTETFPVPSKALSKWPHRMTETKAKWKFNRIYFFIQNWELKTCTKLQIKWLDLMDLAAYFLYAKHTGLEINNTGLIW